MKRSTYVLQWTSSNPATFGASRSVLISYRILGVDLFITKYTLEKVSWIQGWSHFRGPGYRGWPHFRGPDYRGGLISGVLIRGSPTLASY